MGTKLMRAKERYGVDCLVDAQVHIWPPNSDATPWPKDALSPPQKPYPISAEAMLFQMDLSGVDRAIIVPPSWAGDSNDFAMDAARRYPDRFAVMGRFNIFSPENPRVIKTWRQTPGMLGIRLFIFSEKEREWLATGKLAWLWKAAEDAGVPLTMMTPALPNLIEVYERILRDHPALKLSLDHMNMSPLRPVSLTEDLPKIMRLAKYPNFALKASGVPSMSHERYPYRDVHDALKMCFDNFGPRRMFWGTDLTRSPCTYMENVTMFTENLPWLKGEDLQWVMGRAVCAWYGWALPGT